MEKEKIVVGLSGGVDSSVAAYLLKEEGYEVIGVTMTHFKEEEPLQGERSSADKIAEDAARVAEYLGIEHHVTDVCKEFKEKVIDYFINEYLFGRTPNPCVVCNRYIKWKALMERGEQLGASLIATGHYALTEQLPNGRYTLKCAASAKKDQTYALYGLSQEQLKRTRMPLGMYTKEEVRALAEKAGIPVANKPDSMEICFIPDKDYARFIEKNSNAVIPKGNYVNTSGEVLGQHKGIIHYTVGQRKGLNLAMGHPVFVTQIRPETNEVVIGESKDVFSNALCCSKLNAMSVEKFTDGMEVTAKIRYNHAGAPAVIRRLGEDELQVEFKEPQRAVTPGQAVVFYQNGYVAGGGIIDKIAW
ncbi:MAG TPA: tRNA 2-thiouridine(34) synthase MnmA [Candidatus Blautia faecavium]|uniref:tRNA-specific 2-thiouridylase MnmA n=1 Tax=Candidatus Blautia faecavium TaxID=2838487 RepID=A0A9D2RYM7_9FIRM|nr:tRNA 2-thiouridine(34) synthase MnmA [Candidatus Blautia faecavium]